jgi:hypothetical protein
MVGFCSRFVKKTLSVQPKKYRQEKGQPRNSRIKPRNSLLGHLTAVRVINICTTHANDGCWPGFSAGLIFFDERQATFNAWAKSESSALTIETTVLTEIHASNAGPVSRKLDWVNF